MTMRPPPLMIGTLLLLLPSCGHRADPRPPLRRTPPAPTEFRLSQRGSQLELSATAPAASVDGVALTTVALEFVHGEGKGDLEKTGARTLVKAVPGARATATLPLPAPGTLVRASARAIARGQRGARTLTLALVAQPPLAPPSELEAHVAENGVALSWHGVRPKEVAPPVGPAIPGRGGAASPAGSSTVPGAKTSGATGTVHVSAPAPSAATGGTAVPATPPAGGATTASASPAPAAPSAASAGAAPPGPGTAAAAAAGAPPGEHPPAAAPAAADTAKTPPAPPRRRSGFFVYRRAANEKDGPPIAEEPFELRTATDTQAPLGVALCYVVRAVASTEPLIESAPSNEVCLERRDITPPAAPAGLAVLPRQGGLELLWTPSGEEDLAGYRVYRAVEGGAPERLAELPPSQASHLDETAQKGVSYRYTLTAFDKAGNESTPSDSVPAALP